MIELLKDIDQKILFLINGSHSHFTDFLFYWISYKYTWVPFYILLLFLSYKTLKSSWWLVLLFIPLLIATTDQISVHLFKNIFLRYRPCHNLDIKQHIHLVYGHCGGKYGFISSHAANSFALAIFMWLVIRKKYIYWFWILFVAYAGSICYSRIYLGAHYPSDVFVGALVGLGFGAFYYVLFNWILQKKLRQSS